MRNERSGGAKERRNVEIALAFNQFSAKLLELLRMDSEDSQDITELVNNNQGPLIPNLPFVPSSDSISTPRASRRPPVPLSRFESLRTEIHFAIIEESIHIAKNSMSYKGTRRLACASRVFTKIAQSAMHREVILGYEEQAIRWVESDATIRGEFTTQQLVIGRAEGHSVCAEAVERVLALQTSVLRELVLYHVEGLKSSSLRAFSGQLLAFFRLADANKLELGLRRLNLVSCDLTTAIDSAAKPTFQLQALYIRKSTFPPSFLRDIMTSSSTSLRVLKLATLDDDFDWTSITSASLGQLQELRLDAWHIPPLLALISGCGNLTTLSLRRRKVIYHSQLPIRPIDSPISRRSWRPSQIQSSRPVYSRTPTSVETAAKLRFKKWRI